ncbi:MAG: M20/M25/M40 family metallo-hydrolase [Acidobacteria bacterium]|nr:M20/M25/M40 family metallo-hydrolase [Acidobacteriota bacterium]NIM60332.1 M20/M25/M40 family metallo-hydrolase [Acidobacteriota bacterium]NIO60333.1 M20/M25/M40 family metallo-hydrolase [Acidobacteriota bacterium]NIQ31388.1 M20/M25/M40 family metallo-hydrolase [Acidobacteriota bacterium]NIQ86614.1 M20/M25/M40 family metallo-hydrolase [Acidobacteriota bacterium]
MQPIRIDEKRALAHLMDLLAIEGLSGSETKVAAAVKKKARAAGARPGWIKFDDAAKRIGDGYQVGNLIVTLPGTIKAPRRLLMGHMDTVPLCRGAVPVRRGNRIVSQGNTGLGADNRTAVACMVTVLENVLTRGLDHPPLTFCFTVGEEVGLRGALALRKKDLSNPKLGFNIDGGDPRDLWIGALGADRWEVDVRGVSAHAGVHPDHGVSAALIAARAIEDAAARGYFGKIRMKGKTGTANVGVIRGGEATNQVTDRVYVKGESRSHDVRFKARITDVWRAAFERQAKRVKNNKGVQGRAVFRSETDYDPFQIDRRAPVVLEAVAAAKQVGLKLRLRSAEGGLDANHVNAKGIPTVTMGAGQHGPHTVDEYVNVREYLDGCRLALRVATV